MARTHDAEWIERMRDVSVPRVGVALDHQLGEKPSAYDLSPCPACGAERRHPSRRDKRGPVGISKGAPTGWRCHACDESGDTLHYVALALCGAKLGQLDRDGSATVRQWCERLLGMDGSDPLHVDVAAAPAPLSYPDVDELRGLWGSCVPIPEDDEVYRWLRDERRLDPDVVFRADLARVLPADFAASPAWAGFARSGRAWTQVGHRLLVPLYDAEGRMRSVIARRVTPGGKRAPKGVSPSGHARSALVMACALGLVLLEQGEAPATLGADPRLVLAEGEVDFLSWASAPDRKRFATWGLVSGSFTAEVAARVPGGTTVVIATDNDDAGDKLAKKVLAELRPHLEAGELKAERWRPPEDAAEAADANDVVRLRAALEAKGEPVHMRRKVSARRGAPPATPPPPGDGGEPPSDDDPAPLRRLQLFAHTDTANGERLAKHLHGEAHFIPRWKKWVVWDGRRWAMDPAGTRMLGATREVLRELAEDAMTAISCGDTKAYSDLAKFASRSATRRAREAMVSLAAAEPGITLDHGKLDADPWLLNVANGTLDLRTGHLRAHDPRDLMTKLTPVVYDRHAEAPRWRRFLEEVTRGDEDLAGYLQRWAGYLLTGSVREHCLLFLFGRGSNGKGTFGETIFQLLGEYAIVAPPDLLIAKRVDGHPTELAALHRARLALVSEIEKGKRWSEAALKRLTGGDTISARRMNEDFWTFVPTHKFVVYANDRPDVRGRDEGIWRRFRLAPFTAHFDAEAKDPELPAKLREELPGILAWALDGCLAWQAARALREPKAVVRATEGYQTETDELAEFLFDRCVVGSRDDTDLRCTRSQLREAYKNWCVENDQKTWGARLFTKALKERGFEETRVQTETGPRRGWKGVRLLRPLERNHSHIVTYDEDLPLTHARVGKTSSENGDYSDYVTTGAGTPLPSDAELLALPSYAKLPEDASPEQHLEWRARVHELVLQSPLRDLPSCGLEARHDVLPEEGQRRFHDDW